MLTNLRSLNRGELSCLKAGVLTLPRILGLQQAVLCRTFTGLAPVA
ncbi:hypothetical protein Dform_00932 [Dehalogenimonas formicexedens]|uniref:Uncharacterized protein n=1 Tax=Dehalogenimonas formicexedens TaxID=1839801 RepID=A0A1P8F6Y3_9CHLR|nr:hypothetical protein Dform_00905 [Dehalogenimonas formicexedens]APV44273.1 hypothetical protein Dform_00932 [Dehalogenimonas formicexedens]